MASPARRAAKAPRDSDKVATQARRAAKAPRDSDKVATQARRAAGTMCAHNRGLHIASAGPSTPRTKENPNSSALTSPGAAVEPTACHLENDVRWAPKGMQKLAVAGMTPAE
jgi:hypothetical protein